MPSFDAVSQVDKHELTNAVDQANRELKQRFDFKATAARFELHDNIITQFAPNEFQLGQMRDILHARLAARKIDLRCLQTADPEINVSEARQKLTVTQGIEQPVAKQIMAAIKASKLRLEVQIQGEKLRVSGKKRNDLQAAIELLRKGDFKLPLQFENFRD
ncbi:MAG TPA: YajQ family cyclic di-GMP-binding protein [Mizugakiibacter sp.]|nr:YajQ family cyclic di-GMP-binding protein [Mizugakiibacter sp.]